MISNTNAVLTKICEEKNVYSGIVINDQLVCSLDDSTIQELLLAGQEWLESAAALSLASAFTS